MAESLNLEKGQRVSIDETNITEFGIGLGWDKKRSAGSNFDLDVAAALLEGDSLASVDDFIYFNRLAHESRSVIHNGDNLTGEGDGDDEIVWLRLASVPARITKIRIVVCIYQAIDRNQNFGMADNAYIRLFNRHDSGEKNGKGLPKASLLRYDLTEDSSGFNTMFFATIYRHGEGWKFKADGDGAKYEKGFNSVLEVLK